MLLPALVDSCNANEFPVRTSKKDWDQMNILGPVEHVLGTLLQENKWFAAVDAGTLDNLITQMNTMNRWFAKVTYIWQ